MDFKPDFCGVSRSAPPGWHQEVLNIQYNHNTIRCLRNTKKWTDNSEGLLFVVWSLPIIIIKIKKNKIEKRSYSERWQFFPELPICLRNFACKRQIENWGWFSKAPASLAIKALEHLCHSWVTLVSSSSVSVPPAATRLVSLPVSRRCTNTSNVTLGLEVCHQQNLSARTDLLLSATGGRVARFRKPRYRSTANHLKPVCLASEVGIPT